MLQVPYTLEFFYVVLKLSISSLKYHIYLIVNKADGAILRPTAIFEIAKRYIHEKIKTVNKIKSKFKKNNHNIKTIKPLTPVRCIIICQYTTLNIYRLFYVLKVICKSDAFQHSPVA